MSSIIENDYAIIARVHKAQTTVKTEPTPYGEILIGETGPFPDFATVEIAGLEHQAEARMIADVLISTLPGGTLDRLLVILLERKTSSLVVRSW